jgi:hypothetical protein
MDVSRPGSFTPGESGGSFLGGKAVGVGKCRYPRYPCYLHSPAGRGSEWWLRTKCRRTEPFLCLILDTSSLLNLCVVVLKATQTATISCERRLSDMSLYISRMNIIVNKQYRKENTMLCSVIDLFFWVIILFDIQGGNMKWQQECTMLHKTS